MKPLIVYGCPDRSGRILSAPRKIRSLSGNTVYNSPFFVLPDKEMSFVKILSFKGRTKTYIKEEISRTIPAMYPGNGTDILTDFAIYGKRKNRTAAVYFLKNKSIEVFTGNPQFRGILFPLQLVSKRDLICFSSLLFIYPDTAELWTLKEGTPVSVRRLEKKDEIISGLPNLKNTDRPILVTGPSTGIRNLLPEKTVFRSFFKAAGRPGIKCIYFKDVYKGKHGRKGLPIQVFLFIFSLLLLAASLTVSQQTSQKSAAGESAGIQTEKSMVLVNRKLEKIRELKKSVRQKEEDTPVNLYRVLVLIKKALIPHTAVRSLKITGNTLSLTFTGANTRGILENLKEYFLNIKISDIQVITDGSEKITAVMELLE